MKVKLLILRYTVNLLYNYTYTVAKPIFFNGAQVAGGLVSVGQFFNKNNAF